MKFLSLAFCLAAAGFAAGSAQGSPFDVAQTRIVHYSVLDLDTPQGVEALYRRIVGAARAVCGESESPDPSVSGDSFRRCVAQAVDSSVASVDRAELTAYHERRKPALHLVLRSIR